MHTLALALALLLLNPPQSNLRPDVTSDSGHILLDGGLTVLMSLPGVRALATGGALPEDPQVGMGVKENAYPPVT